MRKALGSVGAVLVLLLGAQAAEAKRPPGAADIREAGAALRLGKALPIEVRTQTSRPAQRAARAASEPGVKPTVGTVKTWLALDDSRRPLPKDYTLRAVGDNIEVWVANDLAFPAGDCRNTSGGEGITVTDAQVAVLRHEFDTTCTRASPQAFSVPPARDGTARR